MTQPQHVLLRRRIACRERPAAGGVGANPRSQAPERSAHQIPRGNQFGVECLGRCCPSFTFWGARSERSPSAFRPAPRLPSGRHPDQAAATSLTRLPRKIGFDFSPGPRRNGGARDDGTSPSHAPAVAPPDARASTGKGPPPTTSVPRGRANEGECLGPARAADEGARGRDHGV